MLGTLGRLREQSAPRADESPRRGARWWVAGLCAAVVLAVVLLVVLGPDREPGPAPQPVPSSSTPAPGPETPRAGTVVVKQGGPLSWAPPALLDPVTVTVTAKHHSLKLDVDQDYQVVLPRSEAPLDGGVSIVGGRNVVIIGGVVSVPSREQVPSDNERRGLYLKGQTGTVHVEGVHMVGDLSDGVNLDEREGAVVQIQNVLVDRVHGSASGHHADVLQTWAGPRVLRIDGLRATSEYQGFFLLPNQLWKDGDPPTEVTIRRSLVTMEPGSGYALWLPQRRPSWLDWSGLHVQIPAGRSTRRLTWPDSRLGVPVVEAPATVTLDQDDPGSDYRSPGYA